MSKQVQKSVHVKLPPNMFEAVRRLGDLEQRPQGVQCRVLIQEALEYRARQESGKAAA